MNQVFEGFIKLNVKFKLESETVRKPLDKRN